MQWIKGGGRHPGRQRGEEFTMAIEEGKGLKNAQDRVAAVTVAGRTASLPGKEWVKTVKSVRSLTI